MTPLAMIKAMADNHPNAYVQNVALQLLDALKLLAEIANSDMAQREEDEGNVSPLLEKVRAKITALEIL